MVSLHRSAAAQKSVAALALVAQVPCPALCSSSSLSVLPRAMRAQQLLVKLKAANFQWI